VTLLQSNLWEERRVAAANLPARWVEWRMKPPRSDRGPSRLRGRSHFGAAKARSAAA